MKTRGGDATGPVPAASTTPTRNLRPRQAPGAPSHPARTAPRAGGRITRSSSALLTPTGPAAGTDAVPQHPRLGTPTRSHKRPRSSGWPAGRQTKRTRQSHHEPGFYGEDSDSGDEPENPYISPSSDVEQATPSRQRRKTPVKPTPKRATTPGDAKKSPRRPAADKASALQGDNAALENAVIPAWASLPYFVLLQIFRYASTPLTDIHQVRWLMETSGVCRAFLEPALTALYENPPLLTRSMAHGLVSLLSKDPSSTLLNYRPKVQELWIDVEHIASKTFKGQPLDLKALVANLPRLKAIQFFHQKDGPPYRSLDGSLRWQYPAALFEALSGAPAQTSRAGDSGAAAIRLNEWQWNRRLMGQELDLAGIEALHRTPPFMGLKKVSFVNYQVPSLHAKATADDAELAAQDQVFVRALADTIAALPALEHLSIESSTAANGQLLPLLPKSLKTLELVNCWDVNGDDFANYLLSSGQQLKRLILHHNQSLSLSFLTVLGQACPNLQILSMDCKTFNHHEFYHDSDPSYDDLLTADQTPDWPKSLEALQLLNMKKWTAAAAENLFQSLVDSAPRLLKLRRIDLKAMLSIPIQQRSQMRTKWDRKLRQVFLREQKDPEPLFSLRAPVRPFDGEAAKSASRTSRKRSRALAAEMPSRRSNRIAVKWSTPSSRASSVGRGRRHGLGRPSYVEPDTTDEDDDEDDSLDGQERDGCSSSGESQPASPAASTDQEVPFRHGMCERVDIQLDNQKSTETTLTMDDFLDSERDDLSDDDWVGDDEEFDTGYAW